MQKKCWNNKSRWSHSDMGVSKNRGTPKWMVYLLKWMIWWYPYFWKHPYVHFCTTLKQVTTRGTFSVCQASTCPFPCAHANAASGRPLEQVAQIEVVKISTRNQGPFTELIKEIQLTLMLELLFNRPYQYPPTLYNSVFCQMHNIANFQSKCFFQTVMFSIHGRYIRIYIYMHMYISL